MALAPRTGITRTPLATGDSPGYREFALRHPEFVANIRELEAGRKLALNELRGIGRRWQRSKVRQLLHARHFAILYAYRGLLKAGLIGTASPQSIEELAQAIDPFAPSEERVEHRWIMKGERQRAVQSFGPLKRAQQIFVADMIRALHPPRANQYLFHGGIPAAVKAVEAAYERGMTHAVELDVIGFYGCIPFTFLADVLRPLPEAVVRHVVFDETIRTNVPVMSNTIIRRAGVPPPLDETQGIPLGAATSPIAGEVIIGRLLAANEIDFDLDVITYADNLLVLGRSEQEAFARADHLAGVAAKPAYGSLRLREKGKGHLLVAGTSVGGAFSTGVPFVGQFGFVDDAGVFSWEPAPDRREQHQIADGDTCPSLDQIDKALRQIAAYYRAYPHWSDREQYEARERALLTGARYMRQATPEHLHEATRDIALAYVLNQRSMDLLELVPAYNGGKFAARRQRLIDEAGQMIERMAAQNVIPQEAA